MPQILERPGASQVVTFLPPSSPGGPLTQPRYLGTLGHVLALHYSWTCPGGCDQMSCTLQISPRERTDALNPGRIVQVYRGLSMVWEGKLDEPVPSGQGWNITAHGSGTYGADFLAVYSGTWPASGPPWPAAFADGIISGAIGRGLRWSLGTTGISGLPTAWLGQEVDSGAQTVTDLLNLICTKGALAWYVSCRPAGNVLTVFSLPTAVTNLLVCTNPVSRTLGGDVNTVFLRYQVTADSTGNGGTGAATYAGVGVTDTASVARYGPIEIYADLSSAGVMTVTQAEAVGSYVLERYQRISFGGPFTVGPGQLLTTGGAPVDLGAGMPVAPMVCRLLLTDYGYGGEVTPAPVTFLVGGYEFDDDSQTAQVTPFQALDSSFSGLLSMIVSVQPAAQSASTTTTSPVAVKRK